MKNIKGINNPNYRTGYKVKGFKSSLYNSWQGMKSRCLNRNHPKYHRYGGRGINIYKEWLDFKNFLSWALDNGWQEGFSIDRINNDGDYCPENCQWLSCADNSRKKRTTKITNEVANEIRARKEEDWHKLAKEYQCTHGNIWFIMNNFTHVANGECSKKLKERKLIV